MTSSAGRRILIVDDEETLREALQFNLEAEGYEVVTAPDAETVLTMDLRDFDLIILDIMMGEISGLQLARLLRRNPATAAIPIIFCPALDSETDMIEGLDSGADDYIMKPYSLPALKARVRSALRRRAQNLTTPEPPRLNPQDSSSSTRDSAAEHLAYEGLSLDVASKRCFVDGREVKLPRKEFEILSKLLSRPGHIFSREELLRAIWPDEVVVVDRVVDVNITRIRSKIRPYDKNIVTRSGYGYGFIE